MKKLLFVIGDDYGNFAVNDNVITVSALREALQTSHEWSGDEQFVMGLGISQAALEELTALLRARGLSKIEPLDTPADLHLTHKRHADNVLISQPRKVAPDNYKMQFLFTQVFDRLSDHVTGQHIGAMIMLEAARQAGVAVLELECEGKFEKSAMTVLNFNSKFSSYAFPVPTEIDVTFTVPQSTDNSIFFNVCVKFLQARKEVCEMTLEGAIYDRAYLERREAVQARRVVTSLRQRYEEAQAVAEVA